MAAVMPEDLSVVSLQSNRVAFLPGSLPTLVSWDDSPRGPTFTWWGCLGRTETNPACPLLFSLFLCLLLSLWHFNSISFYKFSRQLSVFSLCSSGLISAILVLSTLPQSRYNPLWLTGLDAPIKSLTLENKY